MSPLVDVSRELALLIALALAPPELRPTEPALLPRPPTRMAFTDQSWLECVKHEGPRIGLATAASRIFKTSAGRYYVPVPGEHEAIMALRRDRAAATRCLESRASRFGDAVEETLARPATVADVYLAHVLGIEPALRLIRAAEVTPTRPAVEVLPTEAAGHAELFFAGGRSRTAADVKRLFEEAIVRAAGADGARLAETIAARPAARAVAVARWNATVTRAQ